MKVKIGSKTYESLYGRNICGNGVLEVNIDLKDTDVDKIKTQVKNSNKKVVVYLDDEEETFNDYTTFDKVVEDEEGLSAWVLLRNNEYEEPKVVESIESQITDLQLAVIELFEMLGE